MYNTKQNDHVLTLPVLLGGGIVLTVVLLTRLAVGSPLIILHKLGATLALPPMWLMGLLWLGTYVLVGASAGYLLSFPAGNIRRDVHLWRGCTFMVLAVGFSLVWYILLFGKFWLILSWICLCLSAVCAVICTLSWWQIGKVASIIVFGFSLWQICLFFLQLAVILHA